MVVLPQVGGCSLPQGLVTVLVAVAAQQTCTVSPTHPSTLFAQSQCNGAANTAGSTSDNAHRACHKHSGDAQQESSTETVGANVTPLGNYIIIIILLLEGRLAVNTCMHVIQVHSWHDMKMSPMLRLTSSVNKPAAQLSHTGPNYNKVNPGQSPTGAKSHVGWQPVRGTAVRRLTVSCCCNCHLAPALLGPEGSTGCTHSGHTCITSSNNPLPSVTLPSCCIGG